MEMIPHLKIALSWLQSKSAVVITLVNAMCDDSYLMEFDVVFPTI